jgi:DNA-directed RNA polymerase specialized sigma24 family protein
MPDRPEQIVNNPAIEQATQVFADHRELLFSIVYNLLGSVAETEDVLQDTWLSWATRSGAAGEPEIEHPRAYLVRIAVNAALLVVLETLTPLERAVFVLHEVFGYAHTEIAEIVERNPAAIRQIAHRAREHVQSRRPRYRADPAVQQQATERFLAAALGGDIDALMQVLAPDVTFWTDGGGKARGMALRPIHGRDRVARTIAGGVQRVPKDLVIQYRSVNGDPSALLFSDDAPFAVMVLDLSPDGEHIAGIYAVTNPDKLTHIAEEPD